MFNNKVAHRPGGTEVALPLDFQSRKITNPDAPKNDHYILLQVRGREHQAIPILFADPPKYDSKRGGEFFDYLQFQFLLVEESGGSSIIKPMEGKPSPDLIGIEEVSGYWEQVGRNTDYIIHPEEILADNFMLMILGVPNQPSPEIIEKMENILRAHP